MDFLEGMLEFLDQIIFIIEQSISNIEKTTDTIDSINFDSSIATDYLGYFHNVVGNTNYLLFTSLLLVSAGVTLWTTILNGIAFLKSVIQWW